MAELTAREKMICGPVPSASGVMGGIPADVPDHYRDGSPLSLLPFGVRQVLIVGITDGVMPAAVREDWMAKASAAGDSASPGHRAWGSLRADRAPARVRSDRA